jgi:hypothetical protein
LALKDIQFFGKVDRKRPDGGISSEYPGWYFPVKIDELEREIESTESNLKRGLVPAEVLPYVEAELARKKEIRLAIEEGRPVLSGEELDQAHKIYQTLGRQISDHMFTRSEMMKGLANPHEEARLMSQPCVDITGNVQVIRSCGIDVPKGVTKISRNQASKAWKILGRLCGERTNVEYLRKDRNTGTYRSDVPLEEMV